MSSSISPSLQYVAVKLSSCSIPRVIFYNCVIVHVETLLNEMRLKDHKIKIHCYNLMNGELQSGLLPRVTTAAQGVRRARPIVSVAVVNETDSGPSKAKPSTLAIVDLPSSKLSITS